MSRAWMLLPLLAACGGGPRLAAPAPAVCDDRFVGQIMAESVAIAATGTDVYWLDYNVGRLVRRARTGGPAVTLARPDSEQNSETLLVVGDHLVWDSKAGGAVYRRWLAAPPGAPAQRILTFGGDDFPTALAAAGDTVYALTADGRLAWWRGGASGSRELVAGAIAGHQGALYVAGVEAIWRLRAPDATPERLLKVPDEVQLQGIAVVADRLFWIARTDHAAALHRRPLAGGEDQVLLEAGPHDLYALVAAPDGVYTWTSNALVFAGVGGEARTVAYAAGDIADVAVAPPSVFVGTTFGSVHELCAPAATLEPSGGMLANQLECPEGMTYQQRGRREACVDDAGRALGPSREWYASGGLKERRSGLGLDAHVETYYADGSLAYESEGRGGAVRAYYANGQLAGESKDGRWQAYELDGTPMVD
jgi:hypothetical protein